MPQRASVSPSDMKGLEMGASSGTKLWIDTFGPVGHLHIFWAVRTMKGMGAWPFHPGSQQHGE